MVQGYATDWVSSALHLSGEFYGNIYSVTVSSQGAEKAGKKDIS